MVKDFEELGDLMEWATTVDQKNPMLTKTTEHLVSKLGETLDKRGVLIVALTDQGEQSMRTDMTIQVDAEAHPMIKLLLLVSKTIIQEFFENLRDRDLNRPNSSRMAVQHFVQMAMAAREAHKQAEAAKEMVKDKNAKTGEEGTNEG